MAQIRAEKRHRLLISPIDQLIEVVDDSTLRSSKNHIEPDIISGLVAEYEDIHYPIR